MRPHGPRSSKGRACGFNADFRPLSLRHSFATHILQLGVDIRIIHILLGHSSLRYRQIYTQLTEPLRYHPARCCARSPTASSREGGPAVVDPRVRPPKASVELAYVVRRFSPLYTSQYCHRMMSSQKKALSYIAGCCTPELGGRLYRCDDCQDTFWHYHCCRNRACPKCHGTQARQWLEERQAELLPWGYFHAVVTVLSQLCGVPSQLEVAVRHADASLGRGGQGSLC